MATIDKTYQTLLSKILNEGYRYEDPNRKGTYRTEIDDYTLVHDLTESFPIITTKRVAWKSVVGELLWFLRGDTNIRYLIENGIPIWNKDAYRYAQEIGYTCSMEQFLEDVKANKRFSWLPLGQLGRVYGSQWRKFSKANFHKEIDQITDLIARLKENPLATDHILTAWNPVEFSKMALKPCHYSFQIIARPLTLEERFGDGFEYAPLYTEKELHEEADKYGYPKYGFTLKWQQRSVDTFLGLPFNIASYALLSNIIGNLTNMVPLKLVGSLSNVHIYDNAIEQAKEQLKRDPNAYPAPKLSVISEDYKVAYETGLGIDELLAKLQISDFKLKGYVHYPTIKAEMLSYNK